MTDIDLSLIWRIAEKTWFIPVSYFSLNVAIRSSLNDTAFNILNDILKICGLVSKHGA